MGKLTSPVVRVGTQMGADAAIVVEVAEALVRDAITAVRAPKLEVELGNRMGSHGHCWRSHLTRWGRTASRWWGPVTSGWALPWPW